MNASGFVAELSRQFPEMADGLDDETWRGLLHVQTGDFARYTQGAIDRSNDARVRRFFLAADLVAATLGDDGVQNAIGVSFLEYLNFQIGKARREWAFDLLSERLQAEAANLGVVPGYRRPLATKKCRSRAGAACLFAASIV